MGASSMKAKVRRFRVSQFNRGEVQADVRRVQNDFDMLDGYFREARPAFKRNRVTRAVVLGENLKALYAGRVFVEVQRQIHLPFVLLSGLFVGAAFGGLFSGGDTIWIVGGAVVGVLAASPALVFMRPTVWRVDVQADSWCFGCAEVNGLIWAVDLARGKGALSVFARKVLDFDSARQEVSGSPSGRVISAITGVEGVTVTRGYSAWDRIRVTRKQVRGA